MQKKILLVEDDQFFREALSDLLKKKYSVLEAPNGKSAKEILLATSVDLVLSDIQMPGLTGLELLEWSKDNRPVPFVIMTGFSMLLETKTAFDYGAQGFIAKPFKQKELLETIAAVLQEPSLEPMHLVSETAKEYCKVSIDEFVTKPKIEFDIYIKLSDTKIIKIGSKGQEIPKDQVQAYKLKGVKHLHILKEDFGKLVEFNLGVAKILKDRTEISSQKKMNFLKHTSEILLEQVFISGLKHESLNESKLFLEMTLQTIADCPETLDLLGLLSSHSDHIYAHSLGAALYAVLIGRELGYESNTSLFKLSLAGMFHDIGKKEIAREILEKPRHMVNQEERKMIESHVIRGQEILSAMSEIPSDVIQMVLEHHEDPKGLGFPVGKLKNDLHPMSKILQCANIFVENVLAGPQGPGKGAPEAIEYIERTYAGRVDGQCLTALKKIFSPALPNGKSRAG